MNTDLFAIDEHRAAFATRPSRINDLKSVAPQGRTRTQTKQDVRDPQRLRRHHTFLQQRHPFLSRPTPIQPRTLPNPARLPIDPRRTSTLERDICVADPIARLVVLAHDELPPGDEGLVLLDAELLDVACAFAGSVHAGDAEVGL